MLTTSDDQEWLGLCEESDKLRDKLLRFVFQNSPVVITDGAAERELATVEAQWDDCIRRMKEFIRRHFGNVN